MGRRRRPIRRPCCPIGPTPIARRRGSDGRPERQARSPAGRSPTRVAPMERKSRPENEPPVRVPMPRMTRDRGGERIQQGQCSGTARQSPTGPTCRPRHAVPGPSRPRPVELWAGLRRGTNEQVRRDASERIASSSRNPRLSANTSGVTSRSTSQRTIRSFRPGRDVGGSPGCHEVDRPDPAWDTRRSAD